MQQKRGVALLGKIDMMLHPVHPVSFIQASTDHSHRMKATQAKEKSKVKKDTQSHHFGGSQIVTNDNVAKLT